MTKEIAVVGLDFSQPDTLAALEYLIEATKANQVNGLVFAVDLKRQRPQFGATGRSALNHKEAAGLASMLHCQLTHHALESWVHRFNGDT